MKNVLLSLGALAAIALVACSSHKNSQGETTYSAQAGANSVSLGADVDMTKLGAPVYPGAAVNSGGTMSSTTAQGHSVMVGMKSTDPFDKVVAYYKQQLPQAKENDIGAGSKSAITSFEIGSMDTPEHTTVMVTMDQDGGTSVLITHNTKTAGAAPEPSST